MVLVLLCYDIELEDISVWSWWILLNFCWVSTFFDILFFNICKLLISRTPIKDTIFWKSMMRSFRWIEINCFNRFRFLAEVSTNLQKCSLLANLRTITQEGKRKLGKWPHFFSSAFCALFVIFIFVFENCQNSFSWGPTLVRPFWSTKHLNFGGESSELGFCPFRFSKHTYWGNWKTRFYFSHRVENKFQNFQDILMI